MSVILLFSVLVWPTAEESTHVCSLLSLFVDCKQNMHVGMEILGAVKKISELGVSIDLPSGLSGFVAITEISEPLTKEVQQAMADDEHKGKDEDEEAQVTSSLLLVFQPFLDILLLLSSSTSSFSSSFCAPERTSRCQISTTSSLSVRL